MGPASSQRKHQLADFSVAFRTIFAKFKFISRGSREHLFIISKVRAHFHLNTKCVSQKILTLSKILHYICLQTCKLYYLLPYVKKSTLPQVYITSTVYGC